MAEEVIVEIPDGMDLDNEKLDEDTLRQALAAFAREKARTAKARERRENMSEEEKLEIAQLAKQRRAKISLQVKYAEDNGYLPSKDEIAAFLAAS